MMITMMMVMVMMDLMAKIMMITMMMVMVMMNLVAQIMMMMVIIELAPGGGTPKG